MWELQDLLKSRQAEQEQQHREHRERQRQSSRTIWLDWVRLLYRTWVSNQ
jgi:hypothetical protein